MLLTALNSNQRQLYKPMLKSSPQHTAFSRPARKALQIDRSPPPDGSASLTYCGPIMTGMSCPLGIRTNCWPGCCCGNCCTPGYCMNAGWPGCMGGPGGKPICCWYIGWGGGSRREKQRSAIVSERMNVMKPSASGWRVGLEGREGNVVAHDLQGEMKGVMMNEKTPI